MGLLRPSVLSRNGAGGVPAASLKFRDKTSVRPCRCDVSNPDGYRHAYSRGPEMGRERIERKT